MEKKLLDESKAILIEDDVYFGEEEETPVSPEVKENALISVVNDLIKDEFSLIDKINGALATFESEQPENEEEVKTLLRSVADEKNVNIGVLTKVIELLGSKDADLMNAGIEKAEEIISEPASTDLNKEEE